MPIKLLPKDFDKEYYLLANPDVATAGLDPELHYMQNGYAEGRVYKPLSPSLQPKLGQEKYQFDSLSTIHNHDFMVDERFKFAYQRGVQAAGKDYQWYWRVHIGLWAAATAIKLPGDFVECGVNRGFLSSAIMQQLDWDTTQRMFYLLDTFQGMDVKYLSELEVKGGVLERNQSEINRGFYTQNLKEVEDNFAEWKNIKIVVGSIPETLPSITSEKIAFLHIDLNCTEPEVAALDYLWPKLVCGAVVLLDDYAYFGYQPQKLGMDEWAKLHNVAIASLPTGQGLIIKTTENKY
jgi:hypothetical protein